MRTITTTGLLTRLATWTLLRRGWLVGAGAELQLTDLGRETARQLVRSHRLWESFLAKHFVLGESRFHESAEQVEHFLDPELLAELDHDLDRPGVDPLVEAGEVRPLGARTGQYFTVLLKPGVMDPVSQTILDLEIGRAHV